MNKELETWQKIKLGYICGQGAINEFALRENERENFKIIESALKRLNYIDEHKIYCISENYLQDIKKIKALKIIKEKEVHIADFIYSCKCSQEDLRTYHFCDSNYELACSCVGYGKENLTQEEYDLLKEVLL